MNAAWLLLPFFLVRFILLAILGKNGLRRAAHFPPFKEGEKVLYWVYQLSNAGLIIGLFFFELSFVYDFWFYLGLAFYSIGLLLLVFAVSHFAFPSENGMNQSGLYRFSRNPMYVAYFMFFIGCAVLVRSALFFGITLVFVLSSHWIILAEERWCLEYFGNAYKEYMEKVRRYI